MTRTKVTKRKLESVHNKVLEPKCTKEANSKFKTLQDKFSALEKENTKNLEVIEKLKEEIVLLSSGKTRDTETKEAQTEDDDEYGIEFPCKTCIYVATCEDELRFHIDNEHEMLDEPEVSFTCNICYHKTVTKGSLMVHRKKAHPKAIKLCRFYRLGACHFKDEVCWFSHDGITNPSIPQTLKEYKCGFCNETYQNKAEFMHHRKTEHIKYVQACRDSSWCKLGDACWYKHSKHEVNNEIEEQNNQNMMKRLFDVIEKYGERIGNIENQL